MNSLKITYIDVPAEFEPAKIALVFVSSALRK